MLVIYDNQKNLHIACNHVYYERIKHVELGENILLSYKRILKFVEDSTLTRDMVNSIYM